MRETLDFSGRCLGVGTRYQMLEELLRREKHAGIKPDHEIDAFGDAYEYLMTMYASNAGKSGGEFFTPADVSVLLTRLGTVGKTKINKVYDIKTPRLIQFNYSTAVFAA